MPRRGVSSSPQSRRSIRAVCAARAAEATVQRILTQQQYGLVAWLRYVLLFSDCLAAGIGMAR